MAEDDKCLSVDPHDPNAYRWCANGAMIATGRNTPYHRTLVLDASDSASIAAWNDAPNRTQSEVVALLQSVGL
jgi:hypothetical protein